MGNKRRGKLQKGLKTPVLNVPRVNRCIGNSDFISTDGLRFIICQRKQEQSVNLGFFALSYVISVTYVLHTLFGGKLGNRNMYVKSNAFN